MVVLGEAVGLVADVLQQPQGVGMPAKGFAARIPRARKISSSCLASETTSGGFEPIASRAATAAELSCPLPPSISKMSGSDSPSLARRRKRRLTTSRIEAKSSTPCTRADLVTFVAVFEGQPVDELHQAGDRLAPLQMGDIDPLDAARQVFGRSKIFLSPAIPFLGSM